MIGGGNQLSRGREERVEPRTGSYDDERNRGDMKPPLGSTVLLISGCQRLSESETLSKSEGRSTVHSSSGVMAGF